MSHCEKCNSILDDFDTGICNACKTQDFPKLKEVLEKFEQDTILETGLKNISGSFAKAEMFNYDDEYFDVELKWGVQSDTTDSVHTESYKINRKTYEIEEA